MPTHSFKTFAREMNFPFKQMRAHLGSVRIE
uniref:Uncharacterized protein n=1 Tax=Anguilla anguilla TaxID=7936 RepID=A0A0E9Q7I6_ANGAN